MIGRGAVPGGQSPRHLPTIWASDGRVPSTVGVAPGSNVVAAAVLRVHAAGHGGLTIPVAVGHEVALDFAPRAGLRAALDGRVAALPFDLALTRRRLAPLVRGGGRLVDLAVLDIDVLTDAFRGTALRLDLLVDVVAVVGLRHRARPAGVLTLYRGGPALFGAGTACAGGGGDRSPVGGPALGNQPLGRGHHEHRRCDDRRQLSSHRRSPVGFPDDANAVTSTRVAPSGGVKRKSSSGSFARMFHLRMVTEYCGTSSSVL